MTALTEYDRLEAPGIWRRGPDAQRRDVTISVGNATLILSDQADRVLAHWSLPAVERLNPGRMPALFSPDPDAGEVLEIEEGLMVESIEKVRSALRRRQPKQGRVRAVTFGVTLVALAGFTVLVLPSVLLTHTAQVVPQVKRQDIGKSLLDHIAALTGGECSTAAGTQALARLNQRLSGNSDAVPDRTLMVMRSAVPGALHLPGDIIVLDRRLVEDHESPEVAAGYVLAEALKAQQKDPLVEMLESTGMIAMLRLLTTGKVSQDTYKAYAQQLLTEPPERIESFPLLAAFGAAGVSSAPYAYALDVSGEATLPLIEADPMQGKQAEPLLSDPDWIRLQDICTN